MNAKLITLVGALTAVASANALTVAVWNFNDANNQGPADLNVSRQQAGVNAALTTNFATANVIAFAGTTVGADESDLAGQSLGLQGGTGQVNNGASVLIQFNASEYNNLGLSYATQRTATGFNNQHIEISTDGINYTTVANVNDAPLSFALRTFDISGLDEASTAYLKFTFTGSTAAAGNNRIDNLVISGEAVPEPATMALLGLGVAAFAARKRKKA